LDHIWVSYDLADKVAHAEIHRDWRGVDKPSDHVPISLTL
jgi:exodeoxyribonuclease-3